ncbi:uncharacterized protein (DUF427 family) [Friedmanniella endophytica]|uniref:Uncharacterized protein (DUF427 family) n=1 Tax=Microlunatus kandeliicorticis TaxID=1759536 RepID=A0A7W3P761_9ACTN|nr:DUF427 domain-containing protein [Microlunatus kandeliicorticis]MBA8795642.1 uncharacterized protein (DUF427 family) [Microlunatus kandeliicorticis]
MWGRRPKPEQPGPGQESVWDYPRPPALRPAGQHVVVVLGGVRVCTTDAALQVLETSHPPTYYLPRTDFVEGSLRPAPGHSFCEWKGQASYLDVVGGEHGEVVAAQAAWYYPSPTAPFAALVDHVALYPGRMDQCLVDGEVVRPQPGGFYGGWVTDRVVGPFKGGPGSTGW